MNERAVVRRLREPEDDLRCGRHLVGAAGEELRRVRVRIRVRIRVRGKGRIRFKVRIRVRVKVRMF